MPLSKTWISRNLHGKFLFHNLPVITTQYPSSVTRLHIRVFMFERDFSLFSDNVLILLWFLLSPFIVLIVFSVNSVSIVLKNRNEETGIKV